MAEKRLHPILLVDDNIGHRTLIKRALRKSGVQNPLIEANGLKAGEAMLVENSDSDPALLIVDLNLGDGLGTALVQRLRESESLQDVPVLIISTSALEQDIHNSMSSGADQYLVKDDDTQKFSKDIASKVTELLTD